MNDRDIQKLIKNFVKFAVGQWNLQNVDWNVSFKIKHSPLTFVFKKSKQQINGQVSLWQEQLKMQDTSLIALKKKVYFG